MSLEILREFEASLLVPERMPNESPFLTGEIKLPTDVTIFLPDYKDGESLILSIEKELKALSLGFLIRHFRIDQNLGSGYSSERFRRRR